jgi:anti-sigma regulatory factor (Ser/Thr protein kinase)
MQGVQSARCSAVAFLRERGDYNADFNACALALSELIGNALRHGPGGTVNVTLDWSGALPRLSVRDRGRGFSMRISLPPGGSEGGRGLYLISQLIGMPTTFSDARGCTVSVLLPVRRRLETFEFRTSA